MSDAMKRVEELLLSAAPAYETYLLQVMGKPFHLKPPLFKTTPERIRVTYESVIESAGGKKPERLVMWVELNRAMGTSTISTEYWQNIDDAEPTARGEAKVDATPENLMAPAFAFGWLHKLVGGWSEDIEGDDMTNVEEVRMGEAEQLILKADEVLEGMGYVLEADSYESYANTLDGFLLTAQLDEQVEGILSKVGSVVRKAARAYGAVKGGAQGLKARWGAFKGSVKAAYQKGHEKGYAATRGDAGKKSGSKAASAGAGAADAPKLKLVKGGKRGGKGGKMSDKEYKARYGKMRMASSLDTPENDLEEMMDVLRDAFYENEFNSLDVGELLALEQMMQVDEGGEKFKALTAKLKARGGVRDPAALAAWIGRKSMGKDAFQKKAAAGRKEDTDPAGGSEGVVSSYQRLSGLVMPMQGWSLSKSK